MDWLHAGVSATVGVVCLVVAALLYGPAGVHKPRLAVVLWLTGVVGVLGTGLGQVWQRTVTSMDGWVSREIGAWVGTSVTGLSAVAVVWYLADHIQHKKINRQTLLLATLAPVLVSSVPGWPGRLLVGVLDSGTSVVASVVAKAWGA